MYPYLRTIYHLQKAKARKPLEHPFQESVIKMRVWPWDIDPFVELNNGRYLTLMDIGRFEIGVRTGLFKVLKPNGWGLMVGAVNARYRRRIKPFKKFTLHTKVVYVDDRWFYFHQAFKRGDVMHASALVRTGVTSKQGLVPAQELVKAMNVPQEILDKYNHPQEWITNWEASDEVHKVIMETGDLV